MSIFAAIYFRRLKNWTMQEQCNVCLFRHFRVNLFSRICCSREYRENKLIYSMLLGQFSLVLIVIGLPIFFKMFNILYKYFYQTYMIYLKMQTCLNKTCFI